MINNNPLITVVTVVYNGVEFLEKTIQNVLGQTYENIEYIIIDGGSTDGTLDVIKKYEDKISKWISEPDKGIYDAMNKGIALATGEWINFMNAGDFFYEQNTLQKVFINKNYTGVDILYGDVEYDYLDFRVMNKAGNLKNLWKGMQFCHQSTFIRSEFHKAHPYSLNFVIAGDFNFLYNSFKYKATMQHRDQVISLFMMDGVSVIHGELALSENYTIVKEELRFWQKLYYLFLVLRTKIRRILMPKILFNFLVKRNWF